MNTLLTRRQLLASAALGAAGALPACATVSGVGEPQAVQLADGVYMFAGTPALAEPANAGRIGNAGFIVGPQGVLAVDTGTSHLHGQALLRAIARVTALPVRTAVITHVQPEFLFGATAFQQQGAQLVMHTRAAGLMASRCETCLKNLRQQLGDTAMQGTAVPRPDQLVDGSTVLAATGRDARLLHFGHSSAPGDVAVLDAATGTVFAGGLVDMQRIPDIQDSVLGGWQQALAALAALHPTRVVPGHGPVAGPEAIGTTARYLAELQARAAQLLAQGASLMDVPDSTALPEFAGWAQYDTIHRRNASIAYLRLERARMLR